MTTSPQHPSMQQWLSRNAVTILLLCLTSTGSFVMGQARGDASRDAKISALEIKAQSIEEKKVSREEFAQFTEGVKAQLQMINENLMALRRESRH
jgi:hypothetical protein